MIISSRLAISPQQVTCIAPHPYLQLLTLFTSPSFLIMSCINLGSLQMLHPGHGAMISASSKRSRHSNDADHFNANAIAWRPPKILNLRSTWRCTNYFTYLLFTFLLIRLDTDTTSRIAATYVRCRKKISSDPA